MERLNVTTSTDTTGAQALSDDLMLIRSVLRGYPASFARADALAAVERLSGREQAGAVPVRDAAARLMAGIAEATVSDHPYHDDISTVVRAALAAPGAAVAAREHFQQRAKPWLLKCFGEAIAGDREERNHRFLEEALELVQACGCTASEAHQLVDYTFGRPVGEKSQEVGGVMVTLAALCLAQGLDMHAEGETELARINAPDMVLKIRAKQAAKPKHSPLPAHSSCRMEDGRCGICGGDWSVCGCDGMLRRDAASREQEAATPNCPACSENSRKSFYSSCSGCQSRRGRVLPLASGEQESGETKGARMAVIENAAASPGALAKWRAAMRTMDRAELLAQQLVQRGAEHALADLQRIGPTPENCAAMLASLREGLMEIHAVANERGIPLVSYSDEMKDQQR